MIEKGRISNIQAAMLAITSLTIVGHLILLTVVFQHSKQDAWIAAIMGTILGLVGIITLIKLSQHFPGLTLIEILFQHFSWPGKIIGILYLIYFFIMVTLGARLFAEAYKLIFEETPMWALVTVIVLLTTYIVYLGLETLGRLNQIMLPVLVIIAIAVVFLTMGEKKDYTNLLPIMGNGMLPVTLGSLSVMAWFGEFVILGMVLPYVQQPKKLVKTVIGVALVTLIFFLGPVTGPIALFGAEQAAKMAFPTFSEVRYIESGEVINRFDAIAVLFWTVGLMIRIALFFYGLSLGLAQALRLTTYQPLVIPLAWLIGICTIIYAANYAELNEFLFKSYVPLNILMGAIIPTLLLLVSKVFFRNNKGDIR
ncbi:GerAB/ArcD/ProY family transporter [Halobacillus karajensis]|uniref:Spore germination protein YndE n=1 Tax=Halobacillus karajensis TaxID=195088 RepID=A0A024P4Q5_9BACI|nr:endospore germination permease [Halobacillus karajensis]CDQ20797.1 Spore germination protein YndE [Halobacillus karajensis]CDQ23733.1 Spore germination protein YndE [Halobacillus karajensis]CDQ27211.1 Spore germination protein YndE [Halobacillus karajensis]